MLGTNFPAQQSSLFTSTELRNPSPFLLFDGQSPPMCPLPKSPESKTFFFFYDCDSHRERIMETESQQFLLRKLGAIRSEGTRRQTACDQGSAQVVGDLNLFDLYQLQVNILRRYERHFKLSTRPGLNKAQLVEIKDTLTYFIYSVKNDKNKSALEVDSGVHQERWN
ncbi:unnamed protein product [Nyctereutes procyonoides]|uniref:(raccoon dog) hypothetical protein n=1 Tax=Nyctereutes procyonoides TaxID=34880 RepID=A0A811ZGC7_NYCPR|nr:unnamed protein product [Nyctereutes procyonoides]